ncbi:MAG: DUF4111 domain-containing protein [Chloroflexi bacterium]|nr:DUF4111 domain-containing protein [Chloroflexota bacterium]
MVAGLLRASGRYDPSTTKAIEGRRPLDLTIVVEPEIRPWRYPPSFDFQYGEWLRRDFEGGNLEPWPTTTNPDVASLITMALQANRPLFGPPPGEVLDPVPRADYMRAIASEVGPQLKGLDGDTCNGLLTLARIWATVSTGELKAKDDAATWAISRLPEEHRPVLARARAIYLGEEKDRWEDISAQFRSCADYLAREIRRVGG